MDAILLSHENAQKIREDISEKDYNTLALDLLLDFPNGKKWYVIRGWYSPGRADVHTTVFPESVLKRYEYDSYNTETDWDQIVRK